MNGQGSLNRVEYALKALYNLMAPNSENTLMDFPA